MTVVRFWFMRHGFSCGNMMAYAAYFGKIRQKFLQDPGLTKYGVYTSEQAQPVPKHLKIDFLFASCLARAIQTAYHTFIHTKRYDGPIWVAPYLRELGSAPDNSPHPQQDKHRLRSIQKHVKKLSLAYYPDDNNGGIPQFISWFFDHMELFVPKREDEQINVVVVTHGGRMKTDLNLDHTPRNNECYLVTAKDGEVTSKPKRVFKGVQLPDLADLNMRSEDACEF